MHTPSKSQLKLRNTTKVMACQNLCLSMDGLGFHKFQTFITFATKLRIQILKRIWEALSTKIKLTNFQYYTNKAP
jgi:hypothetical protein